MTASKPGRGPLARRRRRAGILLSLPAVAMVALLLGVPVGQAVYYSMTTWNGSSPATWIGPGAYLSALRDPLLLRVLENNGLLLLCVPVALAVPFVIAVLVNEHVRGWRFFRSVYFLPTAISWVVIGIVAQQFFADNGILSRLLSDVGLGSVDPKLLDSEYGALAALVITFVWSMIGTNTIIFLTGLATLDPTLIEAARMDGLNRWQILSRVTVPLMTRFIQFAFVITVISAFSALFSLIFVMTGGGPGLGTTTLEFYVYQAGFSQAEFGTAALYGIILFVIMAIVGIGQLRLIRPADEDGL